MKKVLLIIVGVLVLLIGAIVAIPFIYKDKLIALVKEQANANVNAIIDFGEFDLTLIKSFPDLTFTIENVRVDNVGEFEGTTLAAIKSLSFTLDVMSVINGSDIAIKSFGIDGADIKVKITKEGLANYDIAKADSATTEETPAASEESAPFKIGIQNYYLHNCNIVYDDLNGATFAELKNMNHDGKGDFTASIVDLETKTAIESMTVSYDNIKYFNKVNTDITFNMSMDMDKSIYTFKENEFRLNQLFLGFSGVIEMPADDITMDITFDAKKIEFKNILSLVPVVYAKDFESVETKGKLTLNGKAKGVYNDTSLPAFNLALKVEDAMFKYPDLPKSAENINIDLKIDNPDGVDDHTVVNLKKFHVELAGNPIDMTMLVKTPVSDANIDGRILANVNLESIKDVVPMENGETYNGSVTADVTLKGNVSALENERYEDFDASGKVILLGINYNDPTLGYPVKINTAYMDFSPKYFALTQFESQIGKSDIALSGRIDNFLQYYFSDAVLKAEFNLNSNYMDVNELMGPETEEAAAATDSAATTTEEATEIPANLDVVFNSTIKKVLYDTYLMTNMVGNIKMKNARMDMTQVGFDMLKGHIGMTGFYETSNPKQPTMDMVFDMQKVDVQETFKTFNTVKKIAPIGESASGSFSTKFALKGKFDSKMEPIYATLNGGGQFLSHTVKITSSGVLTKIADYLKQDDYKQLDMTDAKLSFKILNGRVYVEPFDIKQKDRVMTIGGSNGLDETLDYGITLDIPTKDFGGQAMGVVNGLVSEANKNGAKFSVGDRTKIDFIVGGTVTAPTFKPKLNTGAGSLKDDLKAKAMEELEKQKAELEAKAKAEADKLKKEAEAKARAEADKLKNEAETKAKAAADKAKKEAEAKAKAEAERLKKEAADKAKNGLNNLLKK